MAKQGTEILPNPYGDVILKEEWPRIVARIIRNTPKLNIYDSMVDMSSTLLEIRGSKNTPNTWIIDELQPDRAARLIKPDRSVLVRAQYFEGGLQHRISFHARITGKTTFRKYPALVLEVIHPIRRISNFFLSLPYKDKTVYIEILVAGGPPEVRHVDYSMLSAIPYPSQSNRLLPKAKKIEDGRVQMIDIAEHLESIEEEKKFQEEFADLNDDDLDEWLDDLGPVIDEQFSEVESQYENGNGKEPTAFIVIDDKKQRDKWREILMPMGWRVRSVESFQDTHRVNEIAPELMIIDVRQRGRHALELIRELKEEERLDVLSALILVGNRYAEGRPREWDEINRVLFVRPGSPSEWLANQVGELFPDIEPYSESIGSGSEPSSVKINTILILEEDPLPAWSVRNSIQGGEWTLYESQEAMKALQLAREHNPDLVIVDLDMPRQRGMFLIMNLKRGYDTKEIPIIAVSGSQGKEQAEEALRHGVADYLVKPFGREEIMSRIRASLTELPPPKRGDFTLDF